MSKATERSQKYANLIKMGLCPDEAMEVLADDDRIDKGEKLFELPSDLAEGAKKARSAGNCNGYTKPTNREKQADPDKGKLIADLLDGIPYAENVEIVNREREFTFTYKAKKYKIVLSCPRT